VKTGVMIGMVFILTSAVSALSVPTTAEPHHILCDVNGSGICCEVTTEGHIVKCWADF